MGDSGEGLVDSEARIQERMDQLKADRENAKKPKVKNPEQIRKLESLRLARIEMDRQLQSSTNPARKSQIQKALEDLDRQLEELKLRM
jgi:hypothetical protein